jgi:Zn-dependent protease
MQPLRFGRVFGIPLEARVSFLVMLGLVLLFMGGLSGIFVVLLAFSSVILHELGHALVARKLGVGVSGIELHFFGGIAKLESQPRSNVDEVAIAAAGPAVSFVLSGIGFLLSFATGWAVFELLAVVNLVIAVFNLIPALPMDGGRILRALLAGRVGYQRATELSVRISRVVSVAFAVIGLAFGQIQLLLLSGVLWFMASAELRNSRRVEAYRSMDPQRTYPPTRHPLDEVMSRGFVRERKGWSADPRAQGLPRIDDDGPDDRRRVVVVRRR